MKITTTARFFVLALAATVAAVLPDTSLAQNRDRPSAPVKSEHYVKSSFTAKDGTTITYWLMCPALIEADRQYPLVLSLHGRGGNTQAASALAADAMRQTYPCFVIAPASTRAGHWLRPTGLGRQRSNQTKPMLPTALEAMDSLLQQHPIDPSRIYVTGQSMGGAGTFGALTLRPNTFAAAIPVCGGWNPEDASTMKNVALWVFHGDKDTVVPTDYSRKMVEAIKKSGGTVNYTEYEGVGHNSWTRAYSSPETWRWLFAQSRNESR